jgi:hypothetical protein
MVISPPPRYSHEGGFKVFMKIPAVWGGGFALFGAVFATDRPCSRALVGFGSLLLKSLPAAPIGFAVPAVFARIAC